MTLDAAETWKRPNHYTQISGSKNQATWSYNDGWATGGRHHNTHCKRHGSGIARMVFLGRPLQKWASMTLTHSPSQPFIAHSSTEGSLRLDYLTTQVSIISLLFFVFTETEFVVKQRLQHKLVRFYPSSTFFKQSSNTWPVYTTTCTIPWQQAQ